MTDEVRTHYGDDTPLDARWYVVHTYSGYENKVKEDLEKTIENRNLQDLILEVKYPTEQVQRSPRRCFARCTPVMSWSKWS